jgi:AMP-polyphosphate phosphotransferase
MAMTKLRLKHFEKVAPLESAAYGVKLKKLQAKMQKIQASYLSHKVSAVIVFEGWDAAGKGGAIRHLTDGLDQRFIEVHPIAAPNSIERKQHYLQRFWGHLPQNGELTIFDRSWYGRVLVERVEGYCDKAAWKRGYDEINAFEQTLCDNDIRCIKIFMHITQAEQDRRLLDRLANPWKRWKTGMDDYRNRARRTDYMDAMHDMFDKTSTKVAPWHIIAADDKYAARIAVLETVIKALAKNLPLDEPPLDPALVETAKQALGQKEVAQALKRK